MLKFAEVAAAAVLDLKKGSRVVANYGTAKEPHYFMGTVTRANKSKGTVNVEFDDGDVAEFKAVKSKAGIIGIGVDKVRKSAIPPAQLDKWLASKPSAKAPAAKTSDVKPTTKKKPLGVGEMPVKYLESLLKHRKFKPTSFETMYQFTFGPGKILADFTHFEKEREFRLSVSKGGKFLYSETMDNPKSKEVEELILKMKGMIDVPDVAPKVVPDALAPKVMPTVGKDKGVAPVNGGLPEDIQEFLVHWIVEFEGGDPRGKNALYVEMDKVLDRLPPEFKKVSGSLLRGIRVSPTVFKGILSGKPLTIKEQYLSFTTDLEVASRFAGYSDGDGPTRRIGLIISQPASKAVLDMEKAYRACDKKFKNGHSDALALGEKEVIYHNDGGLVIDTKSVMTVVIDQSHMDKLYGDGKAMWDKFKGYLNMDDQYEIPLDAKTIKLLKG